MASISGQWRVKAGRKRKQAILRQSYECRRQEKQKRGDKKATMAPKCASFHSLLKVTQQVHALDMGQFYN